MTRYNPNQQFWINQEMTRAWQALARAQNKIEELGIRQRINAIDEKLKMLNNAPKLYPPEKADDVQPSPLDISPATSLQEEGLS